MKGIENDIIIIIIIIGDEEQLLMIRCLKPMMQRTDFLEHLSTNLYFWTARRFFRVNLYLEDTTQQAL